MQRLWKKPEWMSPAGYWPQLKTAIEAGADAVYFAQLARRIAPTLEVHGSTQMSVTSAQGAKLAKQCGCARVVLGRELSLSDIGRIAQATDVDLKVFVHGALCVRYSGQYTSSCG